MAARAGHDAAIEHYLARAEARLVPTGREERVLTRALDDLRAARRSMVDAPALTVLGAGLEAPLGPGSDDALRRACAVFLATPDFLLAGDPGSDAVGATPGLELPGQDFASVCERVGIALYGEERACR